MSRNKRRSQAGALSPKSRRVGGWLRSYSAAPEESAACDPQAAMSTVSRPVVAPANTHLPRDYALFRTPYRVGLRS